MWKLCLGLVLGLVLAEAAFWLRDGGAFPHLNIYRSDALLGVSLRPSAETRVAFGGNPVTLARTNRFGFRGADWDDADRGRETLVLGDSQVFGLGVSEQDAFSAQLGGLLGEPVRNAGIPTLGPSEYTDLMERLLVERRPRRVVYVINLANDLFELERPNRERHAVWDGWAVRIETAPAQQTDFPGRPWLMSQSHLVFAARSLWNARAPDDAAFASEGSWRDVAKSASESVDARRGPAPDLAESLRSRDQLSERWSALQERVMLEFSRLARERADYGSEAKRLAGYRGDPRDILHNPYAESGRPVAYTAHQLLRAAVALDENSNALVALAEAHHDAALAQLLVERRSVRDALVAQGGAFAAAPGHPALASVLTRTARACSEAGVALFVVALPLDVQVSPDEWAKYGEAARDLGPTEALLDLVTGSAEAAGATPVNPLGALREAEPGAFLAGDLHLSPRGHRALAEQLAEVIRAPRPAPSLRLPAGRSFPPTAAEWASASQAVAFRGERASCRARSVREWVRVECFRHEGEAPLDLPRSLVLHRGGHGDALLHADDEALSLVLPMSPDDSAEAELRWPELTRALRIVRRDGVVTVELGPVVRSVSAAAAPPAQYVSPTVVPAQLGVTGGTHPFDLACMRGIDEAAELGAAAPRCAVDVPQREVACAAGSFPFGATRRCAARCGADGACPAEHRCEIFAGQAGCITP